MIRILGERIKLLREERNLSQDKLAELTGISNASISRWENNLSDISGDNIIILCKFFGVTAGYLLGIED